MDWKGRNRLSSISKGLGDSMGRIFKTAATLTASAVSRHNRKKSLRNIKKINDANRKLINIGKETTDQIIPCFSQIGNICITGGEQELRNKLLVQSTLQAASLGVPTIVLHEGNHHLENLLAQACTQLPYFRTINDANPFYEPILRLGGAETSMLIAAASPTDNKIDSSGALYLRALSVLLRKRGIMPYIRMLASCPHNSIQSIILSEEQSGQLTALEANDIRNDIQAGASARPNIEAFFSQLTLESGILAWKSHLSRSTSIQECIRAGGILTIDIGTIGKKYQLSLIVAEIEHCLSTGSSCRLILDMGCISGNEKLVSLVKNASNSLVWTISTPDIGNTMGAAKDDAAAWLALSHRSIIFSHSLHSAEILSKELGEYDYIDVTQAHSGNNSFGQFGLHFGANNNISTSRKRERVIKPEEISCLEQNEFFLLDNNMASLYTGTLV